MFNNRPSKCRKEELKNRQTNPQLWSETSTCLLITKKTDRQKPVGIQKTQMAPSTHQALLMPVENSTVLTEDTFRYTRVFPKTDHSAGSQIIGEGEENTHQSFSSKRSFIMPPTAGAETASLFQRFPRALLLAPQESRLSAC